MTGLDYLKRDIRSRTYQNVIVSAVIDVVSCKAFFTDIRIA